MDFDFLAPPSKTYLIWNPPRLEPKIPIWMESTVKLKVHEQDTTNNMANRVVANRGVRVVANRGKGIINPISVSWHYLTIQFDISASALLFNSSINAGKPPFLKIRLYSDRRTFSSLIPLSRMTSIIRQPSLNLRQT